MAVNKMSHNCQETLRPIVKKMSKLSGAGHQQEWFRSTLGRRTSKTAIQRQKFAPGAGRLQQLIIFASVSF
jgi:hypothetical protein